MYIRNYIHSVSEISIVDIDWWHFQGAFLPHFFLSQHRSQHCCCWSEDRRQFSDNHSRSGTNCKAVNLFGSSYISGS